MLEDEFLDPVVVTEGLRQATAVLLETPDALASRLEALAARAAEIDAAIDTWTRAIAAGGELPSLVARLQVCEQDRARVDQERRKLETATRLTPKDLRRLERDLLARVEEWKAAARRNVAQGRQVLRKLLGGTRVQIRPLADGTCQISGRGDYGKLFSVSGATALASPPRQAPYLGSGIPGLLHGSALKRTA